MIRRKLMPVLFAGALAASAQDSGLPGEFLISNFPSAAAMGQANGSAALVDNSDALYLNPAGLARARYMEVSASYAHFGTGLSYYPGAFCAPLGRYGTAGIAYVGHMSPEAPGYNAFGIQNDAYRAGANSVSFAYARRLIKWVTLGGSLRIVTQNVSSYNDMGVGLDAGLQILPVEWLSAGASFTNLLAPRLKLWEDQVSYATAFTGALGVHPLVPFMTSERARSLAISIDAQLLDLFADKKDYKNGNIVRPTNWKAGLSFDPLDFLSLRAGVNDLTINAGVGVAVKGVAADVGIGWHYGLGEFKFAPDLAFGARYQFGRTLSKQEEEVAARESDVNARADLAAARERFIADDFAAARTLTLAYMDAHPRDRDAKDFLASIDRSLSQGTVGELVRRSQASLDKGDVAEAARLVDQALSAAPSDSAANLLKQVVLVRTETRTRMARVRSLYEQNKYDEVARELDAVYALDSTDVAAKEYRAKIRDFLNQRDAERFVAAASKYYYDGHDVERANAELQKALALAPDHKDGRALYEKLSREIKELYLKKVGRMVEGQNLAADDKDLQKLMQLDAQDRLVRIRSLVEGKQFDQALADVNAVLRESPNDAQALSLKKLAEDGLRLQKADLTYAEALRLYNDGNLADAELKAAGACALDPSNERFRSLLNDVQKKRRAQNIAEAQKHVATGSRADLDEARRLVAEYLSADPENAEALRLSKDIEAEILVLDADAAIDAGDYERADKTIRNALRISPDDRKVQEAFKNLKEAMEALQ